VRLIAATNINLSRAVAAGHFREDLFYRLHVAAIELPPLRERVGDILPLAAFFLEEHTRRLGYAPATLSHGAIAKLLAHPWPGNIRELENVIHHALLVRADREVLPEDLHLAERVREAPEPGPWPQPAMRGSQEARTPQ